MIKINYNWLLKLIFIYLSILLLLLFILVYSCLFLSYSCNGDENGVMDKGQNVLEILQQQQQGKFLSRTQFNETFTTTNGNNLVEASREKKVIEQANEKSLTNCQVTVVIILCNDGQKQQTKLNGTANNDHSILARSFDRQIQQTIVLLKSIVLQQKFYRSNDVQNHECVNVLVMSSEDEKDNFLRLQQIIKEEKWSQDFVNLLNFSFIPANYPQGSQWMKKLFRPCATLRLFLPELLPDNDAVIYLDTDIILFRNLKDLWKEFETFDSQGKTIAAMSACLYHYDSSSLVPYYGKTGLNAGIVLMNLTRMRNVKWTNKIQNLISDFQNVIKLADQVPMFNSKKLFTRVNTSDQDILNIYFHYQPDELHLLTCDWNFRVFQCRPGNALSFTRQGPEPLFHTVFSIFQQLNLTKSDSSVVENLFHNLDLHLQMITKRRLKRPRSMSDCMRYGAFNILILNRLDKIRKKIASINM